MLEAKARDVPATHDCSNLVSKLLSLWSCGQISATAAQQLAHCAILDGANHPELGALAATGAWGSQPGNVHRDLCTTFCSNVSIPEPFMCATEALDPKTTTIEKVFAGVFNPHSMFHQLQQYSEFTTMFCTSKIETFWQSVEQSQDPRLVGHEMLTVPGWKKLFIPCFIHGDGVEYHNRDSLMVYHWGCILSTMGSLDGSLLLAAFPKSATAKKTNSSTGTWDPILETIVWSFQAAFQGKHPTSLPDGSVFPKGSDMERLAGKPLHPQGLRIAIWCLQGDAEYFSNVLGLPHWATDEICADCDTRCSDPTKSWRELRSTKWGWTTKTVEEVRACPPDHLFFHLNSVTSKTVCHDPLHVLFSKGILAHMLGSVLHTLCFPQKGRQIVPPKQRLGIIFSRVQEIYHDTNPASRITNLHLSMFMDENSHWQQGSWPFLKTKASETKHLLPCLAVISAEVSDGSEVDERRTAALVAIHNYVRLMDTAGIVPTVAEGEAFETLCYEFLGHYQWLHNWAQGHDRPEYHITSKFHMFVHMSQNAKYLNPRFFWCFKAEDYVGRISTIAHSVSMGVRSTLISIKLCSKYRFCIHLRLDREVYDDFE